MKLLLCLLLWIVAEAGADVSCGSHRAATCIQCPEGNGASWCNGDCEWKNGICVRNGYRTEVSCGSHKAPTCSECPQGHGATWCNGDCEWDNGKCIGAGAYTANGDCKIVLVNGNIQSAGLYFLKESDKPSISSMTAGTAIYDDLTGTYIYHKQNVGWVVASHYNPDDADVISHVDNKNLIQAGTWNNGVTTVCLDDHKCASNSVRDLLSRTTPMKALKDNYPFDGERKSMDGLFCSRVIANGVAFDYMNRTDRAGFPIYAANDRLYLSKPHDDMMNRNIYDSEYIITYDGSERALDIKFDKNWAVCDRLSFVPVPATSIHVNWNLPRGSLSYANEWELGVNVKVLNSADNTYFCTVGFGPGGYSGIQQTPDRSKARSGKLAIFSLWNYGSDGVNTEFVNQRDGVVESAFGGEGTGRKSWVNYPWQVGVKTGLKIKGKLVDRSTSLWQVDGYVKRLDNPNEWIHMASFTRASHQDILSPWGFYSFVEDWDRFGCAQGFRYKREAEFTEPYAIVDGKEVTLSRPSFRSVGDGIDRFANGLVVQEVLGSKGPGSVRMSTGGLP